MGWVQCRSCVGRSVLIECIASLYQLQIWFNVDTKYRMAVSSKLDTCEWRWYTLLLVPNSERWIFRSNHYLDGDYVWQSCNWGHCLSAMRAVSKPILSCLFLQSAPICHSVSKFSFLDIFEPVCAFPFTVMCSVEDLFSCDLQHFSW